MQRGREGRRERERERGRGGGGEGSGREGGRERWGRGQVTACKMSKLTIS